MMTRRIALLVPLVAVSTAVAIANPAASVSPDSKVSVGSPASPYLPNSSNEPALAMDANHPAVLAAGANDLVDSAPCQGSSCDLTPDIGISGIYFSFDSGATWTQPTYTGLTAQNGTTHVGPIHTLPNYLRERDVLARRSRPGIRPAARARRLLVGKRVAPLLRQPGVQPHHVHPASRAPRRRSVSRTDNVQAAAAGVQSAWMDPVIVSRQNAALLSDKEDIWADNATSSPFFGNVYVCNVAFRSIGGAPEPMMVASSTDGGSTWRQRQISAATNNAQTGGRQGCAVRTDSAGVVYVVWEGADIHSRQSVMLLARSFDGGSNFDKPRAVAVVTTSESPTRSPVGSCSTDTPGPAPTASPASASPTALRPVPTPPTRSC